jgi:branched-chain amino acid transport system substrate-binding protein
LQAANFSGIVGSKVTQEWDPSLDNPTNQKFVSDFKAKFGTYPSFYAAQSYDTINMIAAAVEKVDGDMTNMDGLRAALKSADYDSVRGSYSYGSNNFPVQNFYLREVIVDGNGDWTTKVVDCQMN